MQPQLHYATVTEAIEMLRSQGYNSDFSLTDGKFICPKGEFNADELEITEVYRYEGDSDPADEATVYGLIATTGIKGILVTGYGISSDNEVLDMLNRQAVHKE